MHDEFAVLRDGIYWPCATYAECLSAAIDDPEARMVRRQVSEWQWTS